MHSTFTLVRKYLNYYLTASNSKGHGIHSPFVFDFVSQVLNDHTKYAAYTRIRDLRTQLLKDRSLVEVEDYGAGPVNGPQDSRSVASIARNAAKSGKMGELLFRMAKYYEPSGILELGTSLGLSAAYLGCGHPSSNVITLEGAPEIAVKARHHFDQLGLKNIECITGNFDDVLPKVLSAFQHASISHLDMVFVDGNHRKEPTIRYYNMLLPVVSSESVIIFDDIHWSAEMESAWTEIRTDSRTMLSIDLFTVGMIFFRKDFKVPQHFRIRF